MRFLKEAYLDKEQQFYDYGTKEITKWIEDNKLPYSNQLFDISTLGGYAKYNIYLDKEHIVRMTPKEYFNRVVAKDIDALNHLKQVILKYHKSFPIPYISESNGANQEGRHRMYIAAELFGWDKTFPVLLVP